MQVRVDMALSTEELKTLESRKIIVRGFPEWLTKEDLAKYFENFGTITAVKIHYREDSNHPRFAFIIFDSMEINS